MYPRPEQVLHDLAAMRQHTRACLQSHARTRPHFPGKKGQERIWLDEARLVHLLQRLFPRKKPARVAVLLEVARRDFLIDGEFALMTPADPPLESDRGRAQAPGSVAGNSLPSAEKQSFNVLEPDQDGISKECQSVRALPVSLFVHFSVSRAQASAATSSRRSRRSFWTRWPSSRPTCGRLSIASTSACKSVPRAPLILKTRE
jgi:hypothetical protein